MKNLIIIFLSCILINALSGCKKEPAIIDPLIDNSNTPKDIIFNSSLTYGTVSDIDGNVYKTIQIGTQTWMAENIKTTKFRNGDPIPCVVDNKNWAKSSGAYCWYDNDPATYKANYGALYSWYAVLDNRKIAPAGWHIPNELDFGYLLTYLGDANFAGRKLKEVGLSHWKYEFVGSNNETGFTALPGGFRYEYGFQNLRIYGTWWLDSESLYNWYDAIAFNMSCEGGSLYKSPERKINGYSVRCIKD